MSDELDGNKPWHYIGDEIMSLEDALNAQPLPGHDYSAKPPTWIPASVPPMNWWGRNKGMVIHVALYIIAMIVLGLVVGFVFGSDGGNAPSPY